MDELQSFNYDFWVHEFCIPRQCQDPRDKVFAAHSLLPEMVRKDVAIDYNASISDVFEDVTRAFMKTENPFPVLEMMDELGHAPEFAKDTPSWVPDYLRKTGARREKCLRFRWHSPTWPHRTEKTLAHRRRCLALGKYWIEDKGKEIELFGYHVGTCTRQSNGYENDLVPTAGLWREYTFNEFDRLREYYKHCTDVLHVKDEDIYSFTYTFGGPMLGSSVAVSHLMFYFKENEGLSSETLFGDVDATSLGIFARFSTLHARRIVFEFKPTPHFVSKNPHPLESQEANYGIGTDEMHVGDEVFMLLGSDLPFLLRPRSGGGYRLVGNAFIGNLRDSEWLWDRIEAKSAKIQIVSIF